MNSGRDSDTDLMIGYFEQWLNGLIYELFFRDELHARKLKLFDETIKLNPPKLDKLSATERMSRLRELFEKANDSSAPLREDDADLPLHCHPEAPASLDSLKVSVPPAVKGLRKAEG
jgi:hypothetical protein